MEICLHSPPTMMVLSLKSVELASKRVKLTLLSSSSPYLDMNRRKSGSIRHKMHAILVVHSQCVVCQRNGTTMHCLSIYNMETYNLVEVILWMGL